jgi:tRNA1Val (adenine37-N6)-methyltransferase
MHKKIDSPELAHGNLCSSETLDILCEEKLKFFQKKDGYRFSIDAFLIANFVTLKKGERLLDIGTGCGIIPIYLAKRGYTNDMLGVEIQDDLFHLAMKNKVLNNMSDHIQFLKGDIRSHVLKSKKEPFNVIVSNKEKFRKNEPRRFETYCPLRIFS